MKGLSLFANIGIAEAHLNELGFEVVVANEIDSKRVDIYKSIYPNTQVISGDITCSIVYKDIIDVAKMSDVEFVIATPPCQGMSTAGRLLVNDKRNHLFRYAVDAIIDLNPRYFLIENVPGFMTTWIEDEGRMELIPNVIKRLLSTDYHLSFNVVNTQDYAVPQSRERMILLGTRKDINKIWSMPAPYDKVITLKDAIGDLPSLDPFVRDLSKHEFEKFFPLYHEKKEKGLRVSPWHFPPTHIYRNVYAMQYTPTGNSAFQNPSQYRPKKKDGTLVKGFANTYKRQSWNAPAYTIAMSNNQISTQNSVHPGYLLGVDSDGMEIYSDARVLTIYELMRIMTIPKDWPIPISVNKPFLRKVIGEGIPSLLVKRIFENI